MNDWKVWAVVLMLLAAPVGWLITKVRHAFCNTPQHSTVRVGSHVVFNEDTLIVTDLGDPVSATVREVIPQNQGRILQVVLDGKHGPTTIEIDATTHKLIAS